MLLLGFFMPRNILTYPTGVREESAAPLTAAAKTATRAESTKVAATREPVGSHLRLCTTPLALKKERTLVVDT